MGVVNRIAPIFPVRDVAAALEFYAGLGFATRAYEGANYGFATLDDADELAERWTMAGANVRTPVDTPWGRHEGVLIDLDGNIIRFGSPMS